LRAVTFFSNFSSPLPPKNRVAGNIQKFKNQNYFQKSEKSQRKSRQPESESRQSPSLFISIVPGVYSTKYYFYILLSLSFSLSKEPPARVREPPELESFYFQSSQVCTLLSTTSLSLSLSLSLFHPLSPLSFSRLLIPSQLDSGLSSSPNLNPLLTSYYPSSNHPLLTQHQPLNQHTTNHLLTH